MGVADLSKTCLKISLEVELSVGVDSGSRSCGRAQAWLWSRGFVRLVGGTAGRVFSRSREGRGDGLVPADDSREGVLERLVARRLHSGRNGPLISRP